MTVDRHLETFRQEADELLTEIEEAVLLIEDAPTDGEALNRLFRAVHTMKGSGGMFQLTGIVELSHALETVLDKVRAHQLAVTPVLIDLTLGYRDQVAAMLHGDAGDGGQAAELCRRLGALSPTGRRQAPPLSAPPPSSPPAGGDGPAVTWRIRFAPQDSLFATGIEPALLLDELRALGEATVIAHTEAVPPLDTGDPEACRLSWDIILVSRRGHPAIQAVFIFVEDLAAISIEEVSSQAAIDPDGPAPLLGDILVRRGDIAAAELHESLTRQSRLGELLIGSGQVAEATLAAALSEQQAVVRQQAEARKDSVRVPSDKLDALIDLVGELVTNQARLSQLARAASDRELAAPIEEADRLSDELRDIVLNIRMMPIGSTFGRFKRLVRDLSHQLGKQIDLVTAGAETELDKTVIERLADPLTHLIRNSIDHGIESPERRVAAGKPPQGTIRLEARHKGASVVISIIDDGRGLDVEAILKKARDNGLIAPEAQLTDQDIYALIFRPGFSTAATVSDVSGRGVGMDVVKREIDALRGTIEVSGEPGRSLRIDLSLPLTLAIIDGLLVDVKQARYVIPLAAIEECLELTPDRFATSRERNLIKVRGATVPLVRLRDVFLDQPEPRPALEETVVVNSGDMRVGIVVDHVIGNHQTVIKSLGKACRGAECVSGATIMGDGNVALILDLPGIIRCARADEAAARGARALVAT